MIIRQKVIATVDILYWMPDYQDILQQFIRQVADYNPEYPRVQKFLIYWKENIDAVIAEVQIADSPFGKYRNVIAEAEYKI